MADQAIHYRPRQRSTRTNSWSRNIRNVLGWTVLVFVLLFLVVFPAINWVSRVEAVRKHQRTLDQQAEKDVVQANKEFAIGLQGLENNWDLETTEDDQSLKLALQSLRKLWELRRQPSANPRGSLKRLLDQLGKENLRYSSLQQVNEVCELMGEKSPYPSRPTAIKNPDNPTDQFLTNWYEVEKWSKGGTWDSKYLFSDDPLVQVSFDAFRKMINKGYPKERLRKFYKVRIYRYWREAVYMNYFEPENKVHLATEAQIKGFAKDLGLSYERPQSCSDELRKVRQEMGWDF